MSTRHPTFGVDREVSDEPHVCSLCECEIDEEACPVPLILFDGGDLAWIYCDDCAPKILALTREVSA